MESFPKKEQQPATERHKGFLRSISEKLTVGVTTALVSYPVINKLATKFMNLSSEEASEMSVQVIPFVAGLSAGSMFQKKENKNDLNKKHDSFMESVGKGVFIGAATSVISYSAIYYIATRFMNAAPEEAHQMAKWALSFGAGYATGAASK